jgi:diguanylate cyclase (GGDEF)-like protein
VPDPVLPEVFQAALDSAADGLIGLDAEWRVLLCNRAASLILGGIAPDAGRMQPVDQLLAQTTRLGAAAARELDAVLRGAAPAASGENGDLLSEVSLTGGRVLQVRVSAVADGGRLARLTVVSDANVPAERIDGLTGLSDRQWFRDRLGVLLADAGRQVAVLMIDLDRFKAVNDSQGHPVGDALLHAVAQRLRSAVREGDIVSRLGGDEFAVVMPDPADAEAQGARLVDLLSRPYLVLGQIANIGACVGIAVGPHDGTDVPALVRAADLALYQAKASGRMAVRVFDRAMDVSARHRNSMIDELRRALALRQFELHYQPQTNVRSGRIVGFEALARWRHPQRGLVPPGDFIPLAEEIGLIIPLGEWVLRTACREAASWPGQLSVAVNASARQLGTLGHLPRAVRTALDASGLPACRLEVEITESALIQHPDETLHNLLLLRDMGVQVSMDDFGTGYSSLSQLRSFPFSKLKIDRSFVSALSGSAEALAVVRTIVALGTSLGMSTTAEGVETEEQAAMIRQEGCTDLQGFLVSRPVLAADVPSLIKRFGQDLAANHEVSS